MSKEKVSILTIGIITVILVSLLMPMTFAQEGTKDKVEVKISNLENTVVDLQDTIKSLSVEVIQLERKMSSEVESLRPRIATTEEIAKDLSYNYKMTEGKLTRMETTVKELKKLEPKVVELNETVSQLSEQVTDNKDLIKALRSRVERSEAQFKILEEDVTNEVAKLQGLEPQVAQLQTTVGALSGKLSDLEPAVVELRNTVGGLSTRVETSEVRISEVKDNLRRIKSTLTNVETRVTQITKEIKVVKVADGKVTSIQEAIRDILIELKSYKKKIYLLGKDVSELKSAGMGEELKQSIQENKSAIEALDERVSKNEKNIGAANSMATLGLLGGLAAIVVALVM